MAESLSSKRASLLERYNSSGPGGPTPTNYYKIPDRAGSITSRFPVQLGSYNAKEDQKWSMRKAMIEKDGTVPGVGQAIAPEEYFSYIRDKSEEMSMNDFYNWMMSQADLSTPERQQYWFSKYPWMRSLREDAAKKQHDLDWKLTEIELNGPQKEEDWLTLYMINQGLIQPPTKPTYQLYDDPNPQTNQYIAGLFSPMSKRENFLPAAQGTIAWSDPLAIGTAPSYPRFGASPLTGGGNAAFQQIVRR